MSQIKSQLIIRSN